jgi:hypothetical protein
VTARNRHVPESASGLARAAAACCCAACCSLHDTTPASAWEHPRGFCREAGRCSGQLVCGGVSGDGGKPAGACVRKKQAGARHL